MDAPGTSSFDAMVSRALARDQTAWEHSPIMCGTSEETDCPICIIKYWPLRRQGELAERLAKAGIDYEDLADLLLRPVQPKMEKIIRQCINENLREQQLSILDAWGHSPEREALREFFRELLFDDIKAIAEAVAESRSNHARKVPRKA